MTQRMNQDESLILDRQLSTLGSPSPRFSTSFVLLLAFPPSLLFLAEREIGGRSPLINELLRIEATRVLLPSHAPVLLDPGLSSVPRARNRITYIYIHVHGYTYTRPHTQRLHPLSSPLPPIAVLIHQYVGAPPEAGCFVPAA